MKAVIYARVSSKDQEREGYSIPAQLKLLREYAQKNDFAGSSRNSWMLKPRSGRPGELRGNHAFLSVIIHRVPRRYCGKNGPAVP